MLLTDTLPLRSSAVWGTVSGAPVPLPVGWGRVTVAPIQYSADRRTWLLLDHAIAGVDAVTRDGRKTAAYAWRNDQDSAGHSVALIEFATAVREGEAVAVTLRGRRHPITGALIENPATVIWDLLANIAGLAVAESDLDEFRVQCADLDLTIGGQLDDPDQTVRAAVDQIAASCGAVWSMGMPGIARIYPE